MLRSGGIGAAAVHVDNSVNPPLYRVRMGPIQGVEQYDLLVDELAKLGIADHLAAGAKSADELAAATDTHAASLRRVLRLLVSHGIFEEDEAGRFTSTELGAAMQEGKSRAAVMLFTARASGRPGATCSPR